MNKSTSTSSTLKMKTSRMHPKMWCIWKPAQSGKTRSMQEWIRENEETAEHVNILIASNNRLLVSQLTKRMTDDGFGGSEGDSDISEDDRSEANDYVDEDKKVYSWMSGSGKPNVSPDSLASKVLKGKVTMVVCCANKTRVVHTKKFLEELEELYECVIPEKRKRISIWIDEADVSVKLWTKTVDFTKFSYVDRVVLVSATFDSIFKIYDTIKIKGYDSVFNEPTYLRYEECNITEEEENKQSSFEYLKGILEKYPEMSNPGVRLFAPGEIKVSTHDEIADLLRSRNFAVMVLNGQRKEIVLPNGSKIKISLSANIETPGELSSKLAELYVQHGLSRFPFAITGQICLGRGITFQSPSFMFSHGVIPDLKDEASIYQCAARLLGNTKEFDGFSSPKVFCSYRTNIVCRHLARIAENIARVVYEKGWEDVSMAMVEEVAGQKPSLKQPPVVDPNSYRVYTDKEVAKNALKLIYPAYKFRDRVDMEGDFYKAACGGPANVTSLAHAIKNAHVMTGGGDAATRWIPCYKDVTDASTIRYVVLMTRLPKEEISKAGSRFARDILLETVDAVCRHEVYRI
jgi:hypothetical protein